VTSGDVGALVSALKELPEADRLPALSRRSRPGSWEHRLAAAVLEAPNDLEKIAAVNDAIADLEHAFRTGAGWPPAGIRIALFGATLLGSLTYLWAHDLRFALSILGVGGATALACAEANSAARRKTEATRKAIDALVATAVGSLAFASAEFPERRSRRRGRA
jgi:hypothetical protein